MAAAALSLEELNPEVDRGTSFSEIISALTFAIDRTEGAVAGHALRSCVLGMRIGERMGLSQEQMQALYYALLLKDIGCSSNAARVCQIVGGDDVALKNIFKVHDWTSPHRSRSSMLKEMGC